MNFVSTCTALTLAAAAALAPTLAHAAADDSGIGSFHPLVGVGLTFGGDKLAEAVYSNGDTTNIKAGGLVDIYGGAEWRADGSPFAVQATIGYHFDNASGRNGSIRFERFPIELIGLWSAAPNVRLGLGARYAMSARLVSDGSADIGDYDFKSSIAPVAMAEWLITPHNGVQLRYVHETYKLNGVSFDGSHVGIGYDYYF